MDEQGVEEVLRSVRRNPEAGGRMFNPVNYAQPAPLIMEEPSFLRQILGRDSVDTCSPATDPNCNKAVTTSTITLPVVLAVVYVIVCSFSMHG